MMHASFSFTDDAGVGHRYEAEAAPTSADDIDAFIERFALRARGLAQAAEYGAVDVTQQVYARP